jgi:alkylhydroperoxidase family enzyme
MLAYVEKLTLNSQAMSKADLDDLRSTFSEEQVYDIVTIASIFNFINRIASAFGVELDAGLEHAVRQVPDGEAFSELAARHRG